MGVCVVLDYGERVDFDNADDYEVDEDGELVILQVEEDEDGEEDEVEVGRFPRFDGVFLFHEEEDEEDGEGDE